MRHIDLFRRLPKWRSALLFAISITLAEVAPAQSGHQHASSASEFEVFVAGIALTGPGQPHPRSDSSWSDADFVFGLTREQFRVFGEYFATPLEHDLERFQLGYELVPETILWVGRFHQPASAWNTEHHHGQYLQTAITRPAIENWEDEEGVIPQHITGALLESRHQLASESGLEFQGGIGASPSLSVNHHEPITLIGNNPGKHGLSLTARLAFLPEFIGTSSAGLLWAHDQIYARELVASSALRTNHVGLSLLGSYADWSADAWRFIGVGYYVDVRLDRPGRDESFMSGYLQVERQLPHRLTAFGRIEDSARMAESRYVSLFDDHSGDIDVTLRRQAVGLRWDYARHQALSCEISRVMSLAQRANEIRLQWSAAIP